MLLPLATATMMLITAFSPIHHRPSVALSQPGLRSPLLPWARLQEEEEEDPVARFGTWEYLTDRREAEEDEGLVASGRALAAAVVIGTITGCAVALFKASIAATAAAVYDGDSVVMPWDERNIGGLYVLVPAAGGLAVSALRALSPRGMGPGLPEHVAEVEQSVAVRPAASLVRGASAVATLGTGNALGPEGPSVELGVFISRLVSGFATGTYRLENGAPAAPARGASGGGEGAASRRCTAAVGTISSELATSPAALRARRQLLSAGAAAGVAAGFNAPIAGVFFALEVVPAQVRAAVTSEEVELGPAGERSSGRQRREQRREQRQGGKLPPDAATRLRLRRDAAELDVKSNTAIVATVLAAVASALAAQELLGSELALRPGLFTVQSSIVELPLYVGLGALSGGVAVVFEQATSRARALFQPESAAAAAGPLSAVPLFLRPALGGAACGLLGIAFPQILFFGYSTLDAILATGETAVTAAQQAADVALPAGAVDAAAAAGILELPADSAPLLESLRGGLAFASGQSLEANLLLLLGAKLLATAFCLGAGLIGGAFAPCATPSLPFPLRVGAPLPTRRHSPPCMVARGQVPVLRCCARARVPVRRGRRALPARRRHRVVPELGRDPRRQLGRDPAVDHRRRARVRHHRRGGDALGRLSRASHRIPAAL